MVVAWTLALACITGLSGCHHAASGSADIVYVAAKEAWLRDHDRSAPWQEGLTAMIGVAKKYGWVDEQAKAIRAHVEWPNDTSTKS